MNEPVFRVSEIVRTYRQGRSELEILRGVNLDVGEGEIVALIGPSGAGKSTLLHVAGLLERPDRGEVFIAGEVCGNASDEGRSRIRRAIALLRARPNKELNMDVQPVSIMPQDLNAAPQDNTLLIVDDDRAFLQRRPRGMETRGFAVEAAGADRNAPLTGELDRVARQVQQDLPQLPGIGCQAVTRPVDVVAEVDDVFAGDVPVRLGLLQHRLRDAVGILHDREMIVRRADRRARGPSVPRPGRARRRRRRLKLTGARALIADRGRRCAPRRHTPRPAPDATGMAAIQASVGT